MDIENTTGLVLSNPSVGSMSFLGLPEAAVEQLI